ncbi:Exoglucanase 1 [Naviculisporaceae sp. PSN 640]
MLRHIPLAILAVHSAISANAQQVGTFNREIHPKLQWSKCTPSSGSVPSCQTVEGEITLDSNYRWLHSTEGLGYTNCFDTDQWATWSGGCNSTQECTEKCALEGASYDPRTGQGGNGIKVVNDSLSMKLVIRGDFWEQIGSKFYLLADQHRYEMFTLLGNEFTFDVNLSTVGCGVNAALRFVAMDEDGGMKKFPGNKAGAEYGTGYCDSKCPRNERYVGGVANFDGWKRANESDWTSPYEGELRACCPEMAVWNSNAHSYQVSSHLCPKNEYTVCKDKSCDYYIPYSDDEDRLERCDKWGCSYNPFQMGNRDFYGKGKTVDTSKKFTVVTRFEEDQVVQFFVQDGKKIETPKPKWDELKDVKNGISQETCSKKTDVFMERDFWNFNNGWKTHLELMKTPMVLVMSIDDDDWGWNLFLDSVWPPEKEGDMEEPGALRGDCLPWENNDPRYVRAYSPFSTVVWSNIRFGPIGSTVKV